ncbi:MAG: NUDIX hydrolase [Gemmatimonadota bacterium]
MSDRSARVHRRVVYDGRVVRLNVDTVRFPDGRTGELELIEHPGASAVLPLLDPPEADDPRIALLRQYRYAGGGRLLEVPAGTRDSPDEGWEACARRELEEETGLVAGEMHELGEILTTPGFTDERIRLFVAWDVHAGTAGPEADEYLEVVHTSLAGALRSARAGDITDAKTLCSLFLTEAWLQSRR